MIHFIAAVLPIEIIVTIALPCHSSCLSAL